MADQTKYLQSVLDAQKHNTDASKATILSGAIAGLVGNLLSTTASLAAELQKTVFGQIIPVVLDPLTSTLGNLLAPLAAALDPLLNSVVRPLQNLTDLCSIKIIGGNGLLPDLSAITSAATPALNSTLAASINSAQVTLDKANAAATDLLNGRAASANGKLEVPSCPIAGLVDLCFTVSSTLTGVTNIVGGLLSTVTGVTSSLTSLLTAVPNLIASLPSTLTTLLGQ